MHADQTKVWRFLIGAMTGLILITASAHAQDAEETAATEDVAAAESGDTATQMADDGEDTSGDMAADETATEEAGTADGEMLEDDGAEASRDWGRLQPVADLVEAGGAVIIILIILSIISLMVILVKLIQFRLLRVGDHKFTRKVSDLLADGQEEEALSMLEGRRGVIARVMETALRGKILGAEEEITRQETERVAKAKLDGLEQGLPLLNLIATVSPLLGLLGTVLGMIEAFQQLETAGDRVDPAILSGGIWEALLTTAAGLTVAIPAAAFYTWLQRSVDVAAQHMEDAAIRVFTASLYGESSGSDEDA